MTGPARAVTAAVARYRRRTVPRAARNGGAVRGLCTG